LSHRRSGKSAFERFLIWNGTKFVRRNWWTLALPGSRLKADHLYLCCPPQLRADDRSSTMPNGLPPVSCFSSLPFLQMSHMLDPVLSQPLFFE
jgi:hypothetical protein